MIMISVVNQTMRLPRNAAKASEKETLRHCSYLRKEDKEGWEISRAETRV